MRIFRWYLNSLFVVFIAEDLAVEITRRIRTLMQILGAGFRFRVGYACKIPDFSKFLAVSRTTFLRERRWNLNG
uniref:Putative secreted protein n=1 Tax=Anopheles triannulatus TaxID=58253 RepID=A0A2M4B624_9DIPT